MTRLSRMRKSWIRREVPRQIQEYGSYSPVTVLRDEVHLGYRNRSPWSSSSRAYWDGVPLNYRFRRRTRLIGWPELLEVVGYTPEVVQRCTRRNGQIYLSCIFHEERRPSLVCSPGKGFHCFGCLQTGEAASFAAQVMRNNRIIPTSRRLHALLDPLLRAVETDQPLSAQSV